MQVHVRQTEQKTFFKKEKILLQDNFQSEENNLFVYADLLSPCSEFDKDRLFVSLTHHTTIITSMLSFLSNETPHCKHYTPNSGNEGWSIVAKHLKPTKPPTKEELIAANATGSLT